MVMTSDSHVESHPQKVPGSIPGATIFYFWPFFWGLGRANIYMYSESLSLSALIEAAAAQ
jgi:hypothetical protein